MKTIILLTTILIVNSCDRINSFSDIEKADKITIATLNSEAEYEDINLTKLEMSSSVQIEKTTKNEFVNTFLNESNYEALSRRCKFIPRYAILVNNRVVALFDATSCPRVVFKYDDEDVFYDIVNNSKIANYMQILNLE